MSKNEIDPVKVFEAIARILTARNDGYKVTLVSVKKKDSEEEITTE